MPGYTLEQAQAQLDAYLDASIAISRKQSYEIDTGSGGRRMLKYADLEQVREMIKFWRGEVATLTPSTVSGGRSRTRYIVPE